MENKIDRYWIRGRENWPRVTFRFNSNFESYRIHTFKDFPNRCVDYEYLANAGFYYTGIGEDDEIVCFSCGRKYQGFTDFDSTFMVDHDIDICEKQRDNIPLKRDYETSQYHYHSPEVDYFGSKAEIHNQSEMRESIPGRNNIDKNGCFPCVNPMVPGMKNIDNRIKTFTKTEEAGGPDLTEAVCGFYHTGDKDTLKCFYCAGKIINWKKEEDIFILHAKHYPKCEYILKMLGPELVTNIVKEFPRAIRPIVRNSYRPIQTKNFELVKQIKGDKKLNINQEKENEEITKAIDDNHYEITNTKSFELKEKPICSYENCEGFINYCIEKN